MLSNFERLKHKQLGEISTQVKPSGARNIPYFGFPGSQEARQQCPNLQH